MYRWVRFLAGATGFGTMILCAWTLQMLLEHVAQGGLLPAQQAVVQLALVVSIFVGFTIGWMMYSAMHGFLSLAIETRRDRLLVECWELLQELIAERERNTAPVGDQIGAEVGPP